jgi:hypothetical protein
MRFTTPATVVGWMWLVILLGATPEAGYGKSPAELLAEQPRPQFRAGHSLPPLTRWGWNMAYDARVELCEHWGYALEFGAVNQRAIERLEDPSSEQARLVALVQSDPQKYPLLVTTLRPFHSSEFREALPEQAWCHDAQGNRLGDRRPILSPEAPDQAYRRAAAETAEPIAELRKHVPIAVLHNGGEYGLGVFGFHGQYWRQDPAVVQAKGARSWFEYLSQRKAHGELMIADAVRTAAAGGLYLYYPTSGCPHRNRNMDWWQWCYGYEWMQPVSDIPNGESYYRHFNSGWTGEIDMLTQALNSVGLQIAQGQPLSYNWLCAGWEREELGEQAFGDLPRYMGFLKSYYTAGMIGGVAGYFSYPEGGFAADQGESMPHWLEQMVVLGRVHALFSHLEPLVRQSDLWPGPGMHRWSRERPAYEVPVPEDATVRVVARRGRDGQRWLVSVWAADGDDRDVTVDILGLGELQLRARNCGSVYVITCGSGQPDARLIDVNGLLPTQEMQAIESAHGT